MSRRTVVVVEDEPLVRLTATTIFEEAGITVVEFANGDEAIDYVRDHKQDVAAIFTDVYLPGEIDGLELAGIVSEVCPEIAVLVTSGNQSDAPEEPRSSCQLRDQALASERRAEHDAGSRTGRRLIPQRLSAVDTLQSTL